jgi:hypothetical protein
MEALGVGFRAWRQASHTRREARSGAHTRGRLATAAAEHGLAVAGLGCFTAAAVMVAVPLGLLVAGVALFVLELRVGE